MATAQIIVVSGDPTVASALFAPKVDVIQASAANGELAGREVFCIGVPEFQPEGAAIVWRSDSSPDWAAFKNMGEAVSWVQIACGKKSAPAGNSLLPPGGSSPPIPAGRGPDSGSPDELVENPAAQVDPASGVETASMEPAPLEPLNRSETHASGDWTQDIPPEPKTLLKRPMPKKRPKLGLVDTDGNTALQPDADADPLPAALSEDALAAHFIENYGENWRYVPEWGVWLHWKGDGWYRDTRHEVASVFMRVTREALQWRDAQTLTPDGKRKLNSKRTAWSSRDVAAVDPRISILAEELDADPMILGVPGGVVDLRTGKLMDADPADYVTRRTSVAPADGPHPLFDRVMERAENAQDGMRDYLLRALGYACLTGKTTEEVFFCLVGKGGAGKGSLTKALQAIMGSYADTIAIEALIETKHQRHSQEIAKLEGVRIVFANEPDDGVRFNAGLIKSLTSSEPITAHRMRQDDHTYTPTHKLMLSMNSMPGLKTVSDGAMRRRLHIINYAEPLSEDEMDTTLKERMVAEYPAILATLIRGCVDWQEIGGLGKPDSVAQSVDKYLASEDSIAAFLDECCEEDAGAWELSGAIYRRYRAWASAAGEYVLSQKRFVQTLRLRGFEPRKGAGGARQISGLKLRASQDQPPDERPHWQRD